MLWVSCRSCADGQVFSEIVVSRFSPSVSAEPSEDNTYHGQHIRGARGLPHLAAHDYCFLFCALMAMLWEGQHQECGRSRISGDVARQRDAY